MRRGFSLAEVLIGSFIGLALVGLAYQWLTGSSKILARGQNKMVDTNQAEIVFRWIDQDVHCAAEKPTIEAGGKTLLIKRYFDPDGPDPTVARQVMWTFTPGVDGAGSSIERMVAGQPVSRFAVGTLTASVVKDTSTATRPSFSVRLTMKQPEDASVVVFAESFIPQNQIADPRWNPVGRIPEAP